MSIKRVYIEITNQCNLRCSFCAFHHRAYKEMSLYEFEYIIKQVKKHTNYIYLHVQGEPLLHSKFDALLCICDAYEMQVQLVTNGLLLKNYIDMNHPSIRKVSISMHSIDQSMMDEKEYMDTILQFIECNHTKFYIVCRFWMQDTLQDKGKYCLARLQDKYPFSEVNANNMIKLCENTYVGMERQFVWPSEGNNDKVHGRCLGAKNMLAILSNGNVTICCLDSEGSINLGNIYELSLDEILEGNRYQSIIKGFQDNKCIEELCQKCEYRNRFK